MDGFPQQRENTIYFPEYLAARWRCAGVYQPAFTDRFPDVDFQLQNIVIGPQGVFQEAVAIGTHKDVWLGFKPTGKKLTWRTLIFFPWDPEKKKFKGERMFSTMTDEMLS